jgi:GTP-binding protein EngB required for normal cell division
VTVLACGETGSGKSTIINGLANLCAKSSMSGRACIKVAIPTRYLQQSPEFASVTGSEVGGSGTSSQTQSCASYNMTHTTADAIVQLQVIDSPGFSDTRGVAQDEVNMSKIIDTVSTLPQPLTSLVLVLNGATSRHTINVRNVISRLRGNMPDAVLKNLVIVCTNCTAHTCNTDKDAMRKELGLAASDKAEFFYIQNSAFSSNPDTWTDHIRSEIAKDWKVCRSELHRLVVHLASKVARTGAPSPAPVDWLAMREARMRLKQALHAALLDTQQYRQVLASLDQAELLMKQNSADVNAFSNYIRRTQQTVTELVDASYHSTICSTCNAVCHDGCGLSEISNRGDNAFKGCVAFSGRENCSVGTCRCSYTTHYHGRKTMRTTVKTLETVLTDMKAKYDQAVSGKSSAASMLATLASSRANVEQSQRALGKRMLKECEDIRKICSGFNILDELYVQLDVMRLEASRTHDLRVRDQLHGMIVQVETLCKNLAVGSK